MLLLISISVKWKSRLLNVFKFVLAVGLIYWMIAQGRFDPTILTRLAGPVPFLTLLLILFVNFAVNNQRWALLMRGQGFEIGFRETFPLTLIGLFFNYAMPGGVGGDIVKGYYLLQDHPQRRLTAATSILMDRIIGFYGMVLVAVVAIILDADKILSNPNLVSLSVGVVGLFFIFASFFAVAFSRRIRGHQFFELVTRLPGGAFFLRIYDAFHSYRQAPRYFLYAVLLTVISQIFALLFFITAGRFLGFSDLSFETYLLAVPLGLIAQAAPISPAGVGVGQAAFLFLFNMAHGQDTQAGPVLVTAYQVFSFVWGLPGAYLYFTRKKPRLEGATL